MFNLLNEESLSYFCERNDMFHGFGIEEVVNTFNIFKILNVSFDMLNFNEKGVMILAESDGITRSITIKGLFYYAKKLTALRGCEGFQSFSDGFNNPTQFYDTLFEVDCAYEILIKPDTVELVLSPEVKVKGSIKRPDFKFLTKTGLTVYCECKSMNSVDRAKKSKALRIMSRIEPKINALLSDNFRIEIEFKSLPQTWNSNYSDQITAVIETLVKEKFMETHLDVDILGHKTKIKLCRCRDDLYFRSLMNVGNKAVSDNPTLIIGENMNLKKSIKEIIRRALTQLPPEEAGVVFIDSLNERNAKEAIYEFFSHNKIKHLYGIFSRTTVLNYYPNPDNL
ncbi:MAG: hypothetical protein WC748_08450 [Legionellales bacterium]|jgi:hypothetical protein